ncbi:hypothetical protein HHI36_010582 [Cryptolaemus montrouzieri]|uniref:Uncharacterized protein n=1 Tax=Cryptolaemus montrouzieri TaxID=559131 RepID=A0ABD2MJ38_9CUCU
MKEKDQSLAPYDSNPSPHEVLHIKCYVIEFIREQMYRIRGRKPAARTPPSPKSITETTGKHSTSPEKREGEQSSCKSWGWFHWLALFFLMLLLFLYGAIVGANFCQAKRYRCIPLFPAFGLGQKGHDVIF